MLRSCTRTTGSTLSTLSPLTTASNARFFSLLLDQDNVSKLLRSFWGQPKSKPVATRNPIRLSDKLKEMHSLKSISPSYTSMPMSSQIPHFHPTPAPIRRDALFVQTAAAQAAHYRYKNVPEEVIREACPRSLVRGIGETEWMPSVETELLRNGEDVALISKDFIGLADGVSGWNDKEAGHAGLWAQLMLLRTLSMLEVELLHPENQQAVDQTEQVSEYLISALDDAFEYATKTMHELKFEGSSTVLISCLAGNNLIVASIGDSKMWVYRDGEAIFTNKTNSRKMLGTRSPGFPSTNRDLISVVPVQPGDIIVQCSDGLSDNLWPEEIQKTLYDAMAEGKMNERGPLQTAADALLARALDVANDNFAICPYMESQKNDFAMGGKNDDTTICVSQVHQNS
ncbi:phosphatase 2C-like domain-containing protein [Yarrowia lipolytica]|jgi:protein phosphatase PTC7|uniref:Protein phosphatase n=2 Tax=Yarrowia lipolytica TaxID=4952 RepID=Q6C1X6_YARLI|nr:YALI0F12617p [Yarrowia lipolytica CLIB122]AOW07084.1 hypothetical protein YALI1_F16915g [Yarrowia lipolytica]KAB8280394.1 phosphatase 2C-like domain-containing protein [Yarrowia lipolytica]KAE8172796.1 phosphatase 2C-like domain-containing protein [Yarrowia lipolytica]KAJ8055789.1 phosphatase 2C-like domain-containing protein [Yarrowia lipolytica]RDW26447.1 phosphatase 2C-like domain-containing protein [Yarrowia lipolytica]|eukprot:XP_505336.1 YALI0F12617p [Yarrowia lipolytica CLIB122]